MQTLDRGKYVRLPSQEQRLARFNAAASVDVHCHCLPGLDDGPATMAAAIELCEKLAADGFTAVIATPHQLGRYEGQNGAAKVREAVESLREELAKRNVPLNVEAGADVRVDVRLLALLDADEVLTLGDRRQAILLELPHETMLDLRPLLKELASRGIQPVLSHPERHHVLAKHPEMAAHWVEFGLVFQITAGSLVGDFGPVAHRAAWDWLRRGLVSLVATDAHDTTRRPPRMSAAIDLIARELTHVAAKRLCIDNPQRICDGQPIPAAGGTAVLSARG